MVRRFDYDYVKEFVKENGNGTVLISTSYQNSGTKLEFKCRCSNTFITTFMKFKFRDKRQCNSCSGVERWNIESAKKIFIENNLTPVFNEFTTCIDKLEALTLDGYTVFVSIDKLIQRNDNPDIFSKFNPKTIDNIKLYLSRNEKGYEILSEKYINNYTKLEWKCKSGHFFLMDWSGFHSGHRCHKCSGTYQRTNEEFIKEVYHLVENEYTFLEEFKGVDEKIKVIHNVCKHKYKVSPYKFISADRRCPKCNQSKGEKNIEEYLKSNNIDYISQYRFDDCRYKNPLPFDFAVFDNQKKISFLIEFDGEQHYKSIPYYGGDKGLKETNRNDSIKNEYCKKNKINLIRIPYNKQNEIEDILNTYAQ